MSQREDRKKFLEAQRLLNKLSVQSAAPELPYHLYNVGEQTICIVPTGASSSSAGADDFELVFIVDASGSMSAIFDMVVTTLIPSICAKLGREDRNRPFTIIFFSEYATSMITSVKAIESDASFSKNAFLNMGTRMKGAIDKLGVVLQANARGAKKPVIIIALSDGELSDNMETATAIDNLKQKTILMPDVPIRALGIRIFTSSYSTPSTFGLASIINLSSAVSETVMLFDIPFSNRGNVSFILEQLNVGMQRMNTASLCKVSAPSPVFLSEPWGKTAVSELSLWATDAQSPYHIVWMAGTPRSITINGTVYSIDASKTGESLTFLNMDLIDQIFKAQLTRMKLYQVSKEANAGEVTSILEFSNRVETFIRQATDALLRARGEESDAAQEQSVGLAGLSKDGGAHSLLSRLRVMEKRLADDRKTIFDLIRATARQENISKMNEDQKAAFLKQLPSDTTSLSTREARNLRNMVERGLNAQEDIEKIVHREFKAIAFAFPNELADLQSREPVSYFSKNSTYESLLLIANYYKTQQETMQKLSALDLLSLLSVVGISASGPDGEYPDPMCYRYNRIFPEWMTSMADLTVQRSAAGKGTIRIFPDASEKREEYNLTNVIPIFENKTIHEFLLKHAPNCLNILASFGMRRLFTIIPLTHMFSVTNGLSAVAQHIYNLPMDAYQEYRKTMHLFKLNLETNLTSAAESLGHTVKTWDRLHEDDLNEKGRVRSYYLHNSGTTNSIYGVTKMLLTKSPEERAVAFSPAQRAAYLRALYAYEISQIAKKKFRDAPNHDETVSKYIETLLGINKAVFTLRPKPEGVPEPDILQHSTHYQVNVALLDEFMAPASFWLPCILALPEYILEALGLHETTAASPALAYYPRRQETMAQGGGMYLWRAHSLGLIPETCADADEAYTAYNEYCCACIVEGTGAYNKETRIDSIMGPDNKERVYLDRMKTLDMGYGYMLQGREYLGERAMSYYIAEYNLAIAGKTRRELFALYDEYLSELRAAAMDDKDEEVTQFTLMLQQGKSRGVHTVKMSTMVPELYTPMCSFFKENVSLRRTRRAMFVFASARVHRLDIPYKDRDIVWNQGNCDFQMRSLLNLLKNNDHFYKEDISLIEKAYRHTYRVANNRHGHGNGNPSYVALGFKTIQEMPTNVLHQYIPKHLTCCFDNTNVHLRDAFLASKK
jgi:hypothetical protein